MASLFSMHSSISLLNEQVASKFRPPSSFGNTLTDWARMNVLGMRSSMSFTSEPDIAAWTNRVALNPARIPPEYGGSPELDDALARLQVHTAAGLARLTQLAGLDDHTRSAP